LAAHAAAHEGVKAEQDDSSRHSGQDEFEELQVSNRSFQGAGISPTI
jgi:hypothetical protein